MYRDRTCAIVSEAELAEGMRKVAAMTSAESSSETSRPGANAYPEIGRTSGIEPVMPGERLTVLSTHVVYAGTAVG